MRRMAIGASLRLKRRMFIDKRSERVNVALGTNSVLGRTQAHHLGLESAMGIMAVGALNQAFGDSVMERLHKRRIDVGVALIADRWLRGLQQGSLRRCFVNIVAVGAADECLTM